MDRRIVRNVVNARRLANPVVVLGALLVAAFLLRVAWLNVPAASYIFDETYYVNAARLMGGIQPPFGSTYFYSPLHLDPNTQHPPLGKLLILASISVFGDNGVGWRIPSVVAGLIALIALYGIVRTLGGRPWLAVTAVAIYALDVLTFSLSRIGMLDMMSLAFALVGVWLGLRKQWLLAATVIALGALVKLPAVFGLLAVLLWQVVLVWPLVRQRRVGWRDFLPTAQLVGGFVVVGLVGLWLLDLRFTQYTNPFDHLAHMLNFGFALQSISPNPQTSTPWQWLVGGGQFQLYRNADGSIDFHAAVNPVLLASVALIVPFGAWAAWRQRNAVAGFALIWAAATYLPFVALAAFDDRLMYLYYALPVIPALAMLAAVLVLRLPRPAVWLYLAAMAVAFSVYFPFKALPS
jgi:predicted membrane-bound dolichyl-phosphate-mannose-protein mannosyltransferase